MSPEKYNALSAFTEIINPSWLLCVASVLCMLRNKQQPVRPRNLDMTHKHKTFHCENEQIATLRDDYIGCQRPSLGYRTSCATFKPPVLSSGKWQQRARHKRHRTHHFIRHRCEDVLRLCLNNLIIWI